jgi:cytochrome c553
MDGPDHRTRIAPGVVRRGAALVALALLLVGSWAWAQPPGFVSIFELTPDPTRGGEMFGAQCAACHGANGNSTQPMFPRLSGQVHPFLLIQLWAFREGERSSDMMVPIAAGLSDQDIADITAFLSEQTPDAPAFEPEDPGLAEQGAMLFALGKFEEGVVACGVCHGAAGLGAAQLGIPRIMGQSPTYLKEVLGQFAALPNTGIPQVDAMVIVASRLSDEDIDAVVAFLSTQPWSPPPGQ